MKAYFKAFPKLEIPAFLVAPAWIDESWGNDVTGRLRLDIPGPYELTVWVHPKNPAKRESPEYKRFAVVVYDVNGDELESLDANTEKQCIRAVEHFTDRIKALTHA